MAGRTTKKKPAGAQLRVTQIRSSIGIETQAPRHAAGAGPARHRAVERFARPPRDPGHDRPGAAPRECRGGVAVKLHDLSPPRARPGQAPRRSGHRRQGRQDGRPRDEGPKGPQHRAARFRGWPAALDAADPETARASRTPSALRTRRSTLTALDALGADEVTPETLVEAGLVRKKALVKILGRGELSPAGPGLGPRLFQVGRGGHHRRRWLGSTVVPLPFGARPAAGHGQRPDQPVARPHRPA